MPQNFDSELLARHLQGQILGQNCIKEFGNKLQPGMTEWQAQQELEILLTAYGFSAIWHPSVVKFDEATLSPGVRHQARKDARLQSMAVVDIGPLWQGLEVDCGDSFGFDAEAEELALRARDICKTAIHWIQENQSTLAPAAAYQKLVELAKIQGYEFLATTAGHRLGPYPTPKRDSKVSATDSAAQFIPGGWMLEVHIGKGPNGAFYEEFFYVGEPLCAKPQKS
jgi:hypothetical protein